MPTSLDHHQQPHLSPSDTLDPAQWDTLQTQAHRMLDDMLDYLANIRERPVWRPLPDQVRRRFQQPLPHLPTDLAAVHDDFLENILPFAVGNAHPAFMGWVHGGGTAVGMLADLLAAGLNVNAGGRNQAPVDVEAQIVHWMRQLFHFPDGASGLFVTGASMANLIALLVARRQTLGHAVRAQGLAHSTARLVAYTSTAAHTCIAQAMDIVGLGTDALRMIPVDQRHQMNISALAHAIDADRQNGLTPFFVAATAGTVDTGAIDDLSAIAKLTRTNKLWFHVDGAYGALAMLSPTLAPRLDGIEQADSIAFDFHKWGQVPYDVGFVLIRDGTLHRQTFATSAAYLERDTRGMSAGSPWPCDLGPDLSRSFRALKVWFTFKVYGSDRLGRTIARTCALARCLKHRIDAEPTLEMLAPVSLNIVCFRYRCLMPDETNRNIVADLQEAGIAAPSTTIVNGSLAIRAAIVNHRTSEQDIDALIHAVVRFGQARARPLPERMAT